MTNMRSIFKRTFRQRKNSYKTRKIMSEDFVIPSCAVEMTDGEKEYINGGLYINNYTLTAILGFAAGMSVPVLISYASIIKATLVAFVSGISGGVGLSLAGFIWGTSSWELAVELFSAFSNGVGIDISLHYNNFFGVNIPTRLKWQAM